MISFTKGDLIFICIFCFLLGAVFGPVFAPGYY